MLNIDIFKSIIVFGVNRYTIYTRFIICNRYCIVFLKICFIIGFIFISRYSFNTCRRICCCNASNFISDFISCSWFHGELPRFSSIYTYRFSSIYLYRSCFCRNRTSNSTFRDFFIDFNIVIFLISHCKFLTIIQFDGNHAISAVIYSVIIFSDIDTIFPIYSCTLEFIVFPGTTNRKFFVVFDISKLNRSRSTVNCFSVRINIFYTICRLFITIRNTSLHCDIQTLYRYRIWKLLITCLFCRFFIVNNLL